MQPRKKWYTWTLLLRLVFLGNEYSSELFQTLLAVLHFSSVTRKSQKQSSRGVLLKKVFLKIPQTKGVILWILGNFQKHLFSWNTSGGCFWKAKSRSSRLEVFCKKVVLRNFAILTGKHLCQSLFLTTLGMQLC